jgi:hypothetical protein
VLARAVTWRLDGVVSSVKLSWLPRFGVPQPQGLILDLSSSVGLGGSFGAIPTSGAIAPSQSALQPADVGQYGSLNAARPPWRALVAGALPRFGASCHIAAAHQSRRIDDAGFEAIVTTFNGFVAPASYYTYDVDSFFFMRGALGHADVRFGWRGWEVAAAVKTDDRRGSFDVASKLVGTTPRALQRLYAIQEVAHKVVLGCAPKVDLPHNELIGDLAMLHAGGKTGMLIVLANGSLVKYSNYSQIQAAGAGALSQSLASFGHKVDAAHAITVLGKYLFRALKASGPFEPALREAARELGIKDSQLDHWEDVLYVTLRSIMQTRVNAALGK